VAHAPAFSKEVLGNKDLFQEFAESVHEFHEAQPFELKFVDILSSLSEKEGHQDSFRHFRVVVDEAQELIEKLQEPFYKREADNQKQGNVSLGLLAPVSLSFPGAITLMAGNNFRLGEVLEPRGWQDH